MTYVAIVIGSDAADIEPDVTRFEGAEQFLFAG
jgi:hypothetical protein